MQYMCCIMHMRRPYSQAYRHRLHVLHYTHIHLGERFQRRGDVSSTVCFDELSDYGLPRSPIKTHSSTVPLTAPPSAVCETCQRDGETLPRVSEGGQSVLEGVRRGMKCWQSQNQTIRRRLREESELTAEE